MGFRAQGKCHKGESSDGAAPSSVRMRLFRICVRDLAAQFRPSFATKFPYPPTRGRRECRAPDAPAVTRRRFSARISVAKADRCLDPTRRANHQSLSDASDMAAKYREPYCITWAGSLFSVVPVATLTELSSRKGWDRNTPWPASRW
jgi:hypothetical protein